jgi:hypothetical protein
VTFTFPDVCVCHIQVISVHVSCVSEFVWKFPVLPARNDNTVIKNSVTSRRILTSGNNSLQETFLLVPAIVLINFL